MVIVYNYISKTPGGFMMKYIFYSMILATFMPLVAMNNDQFQVILDAPEYWKEENGQWVQHDLDWQGELCPMGPRQQLLELKYVQVFPQLKAYLDENENRFRGFDPKMFNLLKNCLQWSFIHQSAEQSSEQKQIKKEIKGIFNNEELYSPGKLVDAVYVSRLAGLSLIEKLTVKAFKKRKYNGRPIRIDDVYPSFTSLDQIGPLNGSEEEVSKSESNLSSESEESSGEESSSESSNEEENFSSVVHSQFMQKKFQEIIKNLDIFQQNIPDHVLLKSVEQMVKRRNYTSFLSTPVLTKPCSDLFVRPHYTLAELLKITKKSIKRQNASIKQARQQLEQEKIEATASPSVWKKWMSWIAYIFWK